jgi:hypothetical protein
VGPGGGTWFWLSAIAAFVLFVGRYAVASRRSGRQTKPRVILLAVAAFGAASLLSRTNSPWEALVGLLVPVAFAWAWFRRDRTKLVLGPSATAVDIWAEVLTPSLFFPQARGKVRLFVDEGTIATRAVSWGDTSGASWLGFDKLTFTFRAADCEVERPLMGVSSFMVSHGKPSIVLRGTGRRGEVELALSRPSGVSLEEVQRALIRAGARPAHGQIDEEAARPGPVIELERPEPTGQLPINPNASWSSKPVGDQPPYWPPPPGWTKGHGVATRPEQPVQPSLADRLGLSKRAVLALCGALMVAAWGVVALGVATSEAGETHPALVIASLCLAVALTWWATELLLREWRGKVGRITAAPVTGLAALSILWLGVLVGVWLWPVTLMILFVLPLGFGLLTTVLARRRWPENGGWMTLIGAGVAVTFAVLFTVTGGDIAGGAGIAAIAYAFWLIGVRLGISVERRERRRGSSPPRAEALTT